MVRRGEIEKMQACRSLSRDPTRETTASQPTQNAADTSGSLIQIIPTRFIINHVIQHNNITLYVILNSMHVLLGDEMNSLHSKPCREIGHFATQLTF